MTIIGHPEGLYEFPYDPPGLTIDRRHQWLCTNRPVFLLSEDGVVRTWLVTGWDLVRKVLSEQDTYSRAAAVGRSTQDRPEGQYLIDMDGADHRRIRQAVQPAFSPKRAEALRPRAQQIVDELIDRMVEARGPVDLMESLALPLPITIISEILGVPAQDAPRFIGWSEAFLSTGRNPAAALAAAEALTSYMAGLVDQRSAVPADDLVSTLVHGEQELSVEELLNLVTLILVAGYETTATVIGNTVYTLLTRDGLFGQVRQALGDRATASAALEELIRAVPAGGADAHQPRVATRDTELGGEQIRKDDTVLVAMEAANHDPGRFRCPEQINLSRREGPHLSFGHGAHMCLGAHLARMEVGVALATLTRRLPGLRLAVPTKQVPWKRSMSVRGPRELPVYCV